MLLPGKPASESTTFIVKTCKIIRLIISNYVTNIENIGRRPCLKSPTCFQILPISGKKTMTTKFPSFGKVKAIEHFAGRAVKYLKSLKESFKHKRVIHSAPTHSRLLNVTEKFRMPNSGINKFERRLHYENKSHTRCNFMRQQRKIIKDIVDQTSSSSLSLVPLILSDNIPARSSLRSSPVSFHSASRLCK